MTMQFATIAAVARLSTAVLVIFFGLSEIDAFHAGMGAIPAAAVVDVGGGALLLAGFHARMVAGAMAVLITLGALAAHPGLADQPFADLLRTAALDGKLFQVVAFGAGRFSMDARRLAFA